MVAALQAPDAGQPPKAYAAICGANIVVRSHLARLLLRRTSLACVHFGICDVMTSFRENVPDQLPRLMGQCVLDYGWFVLKPVPAFDRSSSVKSSDAPCLPSISQAPHHLFL